MFDVDLYLELVNEEYKTALTKPIKEAHLKSQKPRIVSKMDEYFAANPLKIGSFNRFENAFKKLNGLLPSD